MKIALVGMGPETHDGAPFDHPEWECWGFPGDEQAHGFARWFEMHDRSMVELHSGLAYLERLKEAHCPVVMQRAWLDIPTSEAYAAGLIDADVFRGVPYDQRYGSSFAYMLAMAIHRKPDMIGLWGIDLQGRYDHQRPNIALLVGIALGRGIPVVMPPTVLRFDYPQGTKGHFPARYGFLN